MIEFGLGSGINLAQNSCRKSSGEATYDQVELGLRYPAMCGSCKSKGLGMQHVLSGAWAQHDCGAISASGIVHKMLCTRRVTGSNLNRLGHEAAKAMGAQCARELKADRNAISAGSIAAAIGSSSLPGGFPVELTPCLGGAPTSAASPPCTLQCCVSDGRSHHTARTNSNGPHSKEVRQSLKHVVSLIWQVCRQVLQAYNGENTVATISARQRANNTFCWEADPNAIDTVDVPTRSTGADGVRWFTEPTQIFLETLLGQKHSCFRGHFWELLLGFSKKSCSRRHSRDREYTRRKGTDDQQRQHNPRTRRKR